ncbi:MAG: GDP-mannose 4,6-dehydratase [bacterium]
MKNALITGITGQDGAYLSRLLLEKGYQVYGISRDSSALNTANLSFLGIEDRVTIHTANMLDLSNVIRLLDIIRPDEIYHLAAQSSVATSFEQPIWTVDFNIMATLNLLEAVRLLQLDTRFYHASSSEMYGRVGQLPVNEQTAFHPVSPYAVSKAAGHWLTVNYREAYGLYCCCGILFNHESILRPPHFVTKKIIAAAVRIKRGAGSKLRLGNVEIRRDWGYAPEYVKAMWLMLRQDAPGEFIIATGESHTLWEFVDCAFRHLGLDPGEHVITDPALYRPADIQDICGDPSKAKEGLGWEYAMSFEGLIAALVDEEWRSQETGRSAQEMARREHALV